MKIRDAAKIVTNTPVSGEFKQIAKAKASLTPSLAAQAQAAKSLVAERLSQTPNMVKSMGVGVATHDLAKIVNQVDSLRAQLGHVDVQIKGLLQAIETKRAQEDSAKDSIESNADKEGAILKNMQKAADALSDIRNALNTLG